MKKVIYSTPLKFSAVILCALAMAVSSYMVTSGFFREDNVYFFEKSYKDSHSAGSLINSEFVALSRMLEDTTDENGRLHPEKLAGMPSADEWEYYIKVNDKEYSNVKNQTYANFKNSELSMGVSADLSIGYGTSGEVKNRESFANNRASFNGYYFIDSQKDSYQLCVRMGEKNKTEHSARWETMKAAADHAVKIVVALFAFAAAMLIYLLCVTGKKYGSDKIQMMLIDKMFVEITTALFLGIFIGGGALTLLGAAYFIIDENISVANQLAAMAIFVVVSLSVLTLLSLVRNMKNGTFLQRSIIVKVCRFLWKAVKTVVVFLWSTLVRLCKAIRRGMSEAKRTILTVSSKNFSGRFVGIITAAFAVGVCILTVLSLANAAFVVILMIFVGATIIFITRRLVGFERIKEGIEKIKNGDLNHKVENCPDGVIGSMAENINSIGDGLQKSLENEVRAERMKSELITNVSHDLKTPLTSIINYADLLSKETLTPPEANDYVKIIKQKGERLKQLTNDLFDISKVQSGNEEFKIEDIDICLLINQTMAELNERIQQSGLVFKVSSEDKEMFIHADGRKMSRVFENLIINCVKYAMKNTRVYINISYAESDVTVEIKNIAGYEMDFDETEISERFVRGDSSRSTEGSGLGLAIVKSYVEACGGCVEIKKDGDLFKVILIFPK